MISTFYFPYREKKKNILVPFPWFKLYYLSQRLS